MPIGLAAGRPADDTTWAIGETERGKVELEPLARLILSCSPAGSTASATLLCSSGPGSGRVASGRGGPLVSAGGLVFVATASDRTVRAYDRDNGKVVWKTDLPTGSEGVPASYEVNGRQFIVFPVAAGQGLFPIRFGGPGPAAPAAVPGGPEGAAAAGQGRGRGGRAGGPPQPPGAYIAYALPQK